MKKKGFARLLALALCLAMLVPALADGTDSWSISGQADSLTAQSMRAATMGAKRC